MEKMAESNGVSFYRRFCDYMKHDTKGVEIASYTLSGALLLVAYRKIRPITRFGRAADIPAHFIRERIQQYGRVLKVEPSIEFGPLLIVRHQPPLNVFFWSKKTLPVKIAGVRMNANGYSWLQSVVSDRQITFLPVVEEASRRNKNTYAECCVYVTDRTMNSGGKTTASRQIDVGQALLKLGFATLEVSVPSKQPIVSKDPFERFIQAYFRALARSENLAKSKRNGVWQQTLPPKLWPAKLWESTWERLLPASRRLPELVR